MTPSGSDRDASPGLGPIAVCAACGAPALTGGQFVAVAGQLGFSVDPISGMASYATIFPVISSAAALPQTEAARQLQYEAIQSRRGFVCLACGNVHCAGCLEGARRSSVEGGLTCPSCNEGPHAVLER